MKLEEIVGYLLCPVTGKSLEIIDLTAENATGLTKDNQAAVPRTGGDATPVGPTDRVLLAEGSSHAYPVIDEFAVLLAPEQLVRSEQLEGHAAVDLRDPKYAEAYEEMEFYNAVGEERLRTEDPETINSIMGPLAAYPDIPSIAESFPEPAAIWIDARHDSLSQLDAYQYLAPVRDKVFVQLGGSGSHAVKALLAGAKHAILLTPMLGEARFAVRLAENFDVADRLACVLGVGEELPFADDSIDLAYSGGCFHHMRLDHVATELHRVLKTGGRFSGVDPWKTPFHTIGTKVLGKRESSVYCRPITFERLAPVEAQFHDLVVRRNGPFLRYVFLAFEKAHIKLPTTAMMRITRVDNLLGQPLGLKDRFGGSLVIAGTK